MFLDQEDISILKEFSKLREGESTSTWKIMRSLYPKGQDKELQRVKAKIERMAEKGLFKVEGNPKTYTMDSDKVFLKRIHFPLKTTQAISVIVDDKWYSCEC